MLLGVFLLVEKKNKTKKKKKKPQYLERKKTFI